MELKWSTYDEYLNHIDAAKFSVNIATQIGHNTVRAHVMGNYSKHNPSKSELEKHLLGPTGNLRAPTLRKGKTMIVGYNEEVYQEIFG